MKKNLKNKIREVKIDIASWLRKIPFSHKYLGIPRNRIDISETLTYFQDQKNSLMFYKRFRNKKIALEPAIYINRLDRNLYCTDLWEVENYLIRLLKGKYCHIHISVITKEGFQLALASNHSNVSQREHPLFSKLFLPRIKKYLGVGLLLSTPNDNNYYHCLFQIAPKIWFLEKHGIQLQDINLFLLEVSESHFQREIIDFLKIDVTKIINLKLQKYVEVEQLLITPIFTRPEPWICLKLRNIFISEEKRTLNNKKIYISRNKAKFRRVLQERELMKLLHRFGFKVINTEGMKIKEQAKTFNNAEMIIAPHGAGLANIVFCEPGTKILELRAENHQDDLGTVYEHLSSICKLKHYTYLCKEVKNDWENKPKFSDLKVDVVYLENFLRNIISEEVKQLDSAE